MQKSDAIQETFSQLVSLIDCTGMSSLLFFFSTFLVRLQIYQYKDFE